MQSLVSANGYSVTLVPTLRLVTMERDRLQKAWKWIGHFSVAHWFLSFGWVSGLTAILRPYVSLPLAWLVVLALGISALICGGYLMWRGTLPNRATFSRSWRSQTPDEQFGALIKKAYREEKGRAARQPEPQLSCCAEVLEDGRVKIGLNSEAPEASLKGRLHWAYEAACSVEMPDAAGKSSTPRYVSLRAGKQLTLIYPNDFDQGDVPAFPLPPGLYGVRFSIGRPSSTRTVEAKERPRCTFAIPRRIAIVSPEAKRTLLGLQILRVVDQMETWLATFAPVHWPAAGEDGSAAEEENEARNIRARHEFADRFQNDVEHSHDELKAFEILDPGVERHYNPPEVYSDAQAFPSLLREWALRTLRHEEVATSV